MKLYQPTKETEYFEINCNNIFVVRDGEPFNIAVEDTKPDEPLFLWGYGLVPVFRTKEEAVACFRRERTRELLSRIARYRRELERYGVTWLNVGRATL